MNEPNAPAGLLAWDTEFFGRRIARVRGDTLNTPRVQQLLDWRRANQVECLYFLARANDPETILTAERHGFNLVDIRVEFETKTAIANADPLPEIQPFRQDHVPALQALARSAHTDTRFFSDMHFPRERAAELYASWISRDCENNPEGVLVVLTPAGQAAGYISCSVDSFCGSGHIGLIAVAEDARGRGFGKKLVLAALHTLALRGVKAATVVTQGRNIAAQRLYERCGFGIKDLKLWYHYWHSVC